MPKRSGYQSSSACHQWGQQRPIAAVRHGGHSRTFNCDVIKAVTAEAAFLVLLQKDSAAGTDSWRRWHTDGKHSSSRSWTSGEGTQLCILVVDHVVVLKHNNKLKNSITSNESTWKSLAEEVLCLKVDYFYCVFCISLHRMEKQKQLKTKSLVANEDTSIQLPKLLLPKVFTILSLNFTNKEAVALHAFCNVIWVSFLQTFTFVIVRNSTKNRNGKCFLFHSYS